MLSKRARPMIGKLSELLVSGGRATLPDTAGSPRGPLDMNLRMQSPRGLKNYDLGGVGLGIVVALDKSSEVGGEILPKYAVFPSNLNRSEPIPVHSIKSPDGLQKGTNEIDVGSSENYTYVTCHAPDKSFTKVYYDGGEGESWRRLGGCINNNYNNVGVLRRKPTTLVEAEPSYPTSDFLSSCHLCKRKLHGRDIYMYRGERAFCSPECRSSHMMDERKEQCRSEASSWSAELSSSPYQRDQIFSTGIIAI